MVGSSISAMAFAEKNGYQIIFKNLSPPQIFESGYDSWKEAFVQNCLEGKILFHSVINNIQVDSNKKILMIRTKNFTNHTINYDNIFIFETSGVNFVDYSPYKVSEKNFVYDWYKIDSLDSDIDSSLIENLPLVTRAWLHNKNLVTELILNESQLNDVLFSDTYYKFMIQNCLLENGYLGRKNGFSQEGKQKHLAIEISSTKREVKKDVDFYFEDIKDVIFYYD